MKSTTVAGLGIVASIWTWFNATELHPLARGLTAILVGVLPAFAIVQARAASQLDVLPSRNKLYAGTIVWLWGLAFATAVVATESRMDPRLLGVTGLPWATFFLWLAFALTGVAALLLAFKAFVVT